MKKLSLAVGLILGLGILTFSACGREGNNNSLVTPVAACSNAFDDDNDGLIDMADPGCSAITDTSEYGTNQCDDGIDNDGDTSTDWPADIGCASSTDTSEAGAWAELAGSATGGGISNNSGWSDLPSIALDAGGYPVVAWYDETSGNGEIYVMRWAP